MPHQVQSPCLHTSGLVSSHLAVPTLTHGSSLIKSFYVADHKTHNTSAVIDLYSTALYIALCNVAKNVVDWITKVPLSMDTG